MTPEEMDSAMGVEAELRDARASLEESIEILRWAEDRYQRTKANYNEVIKRHRDRIEKEQKR